jgi:predicted AlkP superfamily phosphohydrolase/phosphomutase
MKYWGYDLRNRDKYVKCFSDTINRFYEWADERIGPVLDEMGPRDTLVIVSDHGFGPYYTECGYSTEVEGHTFSGSHAHFGVIMMYGANIKKGYRLKGPPPKVTDVLPTVLSLMKVPVAQWMQGFPITQAFTDRFDKTYDPVWVREYGIEDNFGKQNPSSPFDEDFVKRMKSLGYLQ